MEYLKLKMKKYGNLWMPSIILYSHQYLHQYGEIKVENEELCKFMDTVHKSLLS